MGFNIFLPVMAIMFTSSSIKIIRLCDISQTWWHHKNGDDAAEIIRKVFYCTVQGVESEISILYMIMIMISIISNAVENIFSQELYTGTRVQNFIFYQFSCFSPMTKFKSDDGVVSILFWMLSALMHSLKHYFED